MELTTFVVSGDVFHCTVAPAANPVPFTVSVKAALKAITELGLTEVTAGGALIVNVRALDDV